jgi:hypothetical protein
MEVRRSGIKLWCHQWGAVWPWMKLHLTIHICKMGTGSPVQLTAENACEDQASIKHLEELYKCQALFLVSWRLCQQFSSWSLKSSSRENIMGAGVKWSNVLLTFAVSDVHPGWVLKMKIGGLTAWGSPRVEAVHLLLGVHPGNSGDNHAVMNRGPGHHMTTGGDIRSFSSAIGSSCSWAAPSLEGRPGLMTTEPHQQPIRKSPRPFAHRERAVNFCSSLAEHFTDLVFFLKFFLFGGEIHIRLTILKSTTQQPLVQQPSPLSSSTCYLYLSLTIFQGIKDLLPALSSGRRKARRALVICPRLDN